MVLIQVFFKHFKHDGLSTALSTVWEQEFPCADWAMLIQERRCQLRPNSVFFTHHSKSLNQIHDRLML